MTDERLIVVGVDGSEGGRRALEWAVREAHDRGGTVQAVAAWRWDLAGAEAGAGAVGPDQGMAQAEEMLAREIASLPAGRAVASQVLEGRPAEVLGTAARNADLLVLGSHGHSRVWHTVLGSVAEECVRRATCPVVVIPVPHEAGRPAGAPAVRESESAGAAGRAGAPGSGKEPR